MYTRHSAPPFCVCFLRICEVPLIHRAVWKKVFLTKRGGASTVERRKSVPGIVFYIFHAKIHLILYHFVFLTALLVSCIADVTQNHTGDSAMMNKVSLCHDIKFSVFSYRFPMYFVSYLFYLICTSPMTSGRDLQQYNVFVVTILKLFTAILRKKIRE